MESWKDKQRDEMDVRWRKWRDAERERERDGKIEMDR